MMKLYFTFGSNERFPYGINDYVVAIGKDRSDCIKAFCDKHPSQDGSSLINCAFYYEQKEWDDIKEKYYKDVQPKEILTSDAAYGKKPEGFDPFWLIVPSKGDIFFCQEGSGDSLSPEDLKNGFIDYIDCEAYHLSPEGGITDTNGGILMLTEYVQDKYDRLADAIPEILDFFYDYMTLDIVIMQNDPL